MRAMLAQEAPTMAALVAKLPAVAQMPPALLTVQVGRAGAGGSTSHASTPADFKALNACGHAIDRQGPADWCMHVMVQAVLLMAAQPAARLAASRWVPLRLRQGQRAAALGADDESNGEGEDGCTKRKKAAAEKKKRR
jgi:hypothetical protein